MKTELLHKNVNKVEEYSKKRRQDDVNENDENANNIIFFIMYVNKFRKTKTNRPGSTT